MLTWFLDFPDFFLEDGRVIEANRQEIKLAVENDRPLLDIKDVRIHPSSGRMAGLRASLDRTNGPLIPIKE